MCIREAVAFNGPDMEIHLFQKIIDEGTPYFRYISLCVALTQWETNRHFPSASIAPIPGPDFP